MCCFMVFRCWGRKGKASSKSHRQYIKWVMNWIIGQETISGSFKKVLSVDTGKILAVLVEQTNLPATHWLWSFCKAQSGNPPQGQALAV